jgi:hypothetical protein
MRTQPWWNRTHGNPDQFPDDSNRSGDNLRPSLVHRELDLTDPATRETGVGDYPADFDRDLGN